jgi:hypothetical protein
MAWQAVCDHIYLAAARWGIPAVGAFKSLGPRQEMQAVGACAWWIGLYMVGCIQRMQTARMVPGPRQVDQRVQRVRWLGRAQPCDALS